MKRYAVRAGALPAVLALVGVIGVVPVAAGTATSPAPVRFTDASAYRWPIDGGPRVVRRFDPPPQPWSPGHRGVDLAAQTGSLVRSAGVGVVHFVGRIAGRGVVSVSHPGGLRSTYEPVEPAVSAGDRLAAGDPIGTLVVGHRGCPALACLHWGLRRGEVYLDPLSLVGLGRVRLLPVAAPGARVRWVQDSPDKKAGRRRARSSYSPAWL